MPELVVARIGRPQGLRGEVSAEVRTDDPDKRFVVGTSLRTDPASAGPLTLRSVRDQSGRTILGFEDISDRTAAEGLRGVLLVVDVSDEPLGVDPGQDPTNDQDEWYDHQLVGLRARTTDGRELGTVVEVQHLPVQDLLTVRTPDGRRVLVPFVRAIVPVVDVAGDQVVMDPPGGLFEDLPDDPPADPSAGWSDGSSEDPSADPSADGRS
jgi:16S rRNA processing protein RimM